MTNEICLRSSMVRASNIQSRGRGFDPRDDHYFLWDLKPMDRVHRAINRVHGKEPGEMNARFLSLSCTIPHMRISRWREYKKRKNDKLLPLSF